MYDIAVVGSGFAGSLLAAIASRLGRSVILLESGKHPRFAIGESSTPLANLLLEELAVRYHLPTIALLAKWGTWQDRYPDVACGLKRGFSFFHHTLGERMAPELDRENQLLVAASPHDRIADVHWYRSEFDSLLVREAQGAGVDFVDEVKLQAVRENCDSLSLEGTRHECRFGVRARFVVDGSGPAGFMQKVLQLPSRSFAGFPETQSLYTHFTGVRPFADCANLGPQQPPYPVDDAAVHHIFDGGWIWILRFNNGITSAGVAASDHVANRFRLAEGEPAWKRLLQELPSVRDQFRDAQPTRPFTHAAKLSFRSGAIAGARWALLPSAAGFIDPLLSTGFPLTLLGITRLAAILEKAWDSQDFVPLLQEYARQTEDELLAASRLIAALYASMGNFPLFSDLTLLYFAAASFSETARRLDRPELASSFLLHDHPVFGPASQALLTRLLAAENRPAAQDVRRSVREIIEPINIAGLGEEARRNWYPVIAEDLLSAAHKVQSNRKDIGSLLDRSGFWGHRE